MADQPANPVNDPTSIRKVGGGLFVLIMVLLAWIYLLAGAANDKDALLFGNEWIGIGRITYDQVLILAVIAAGALGGCVHVASSFSDYVGNVKYKASWEWWYLLRPFVGSALAMVFYFLIRGNLFSLTPDANPAPPSFYAAAGVAFLVGMFSKQASDKLDDLFDTLFKSNKDAHRSDGLDEKVPELSKVTPPSVEAGTASQEVVIAGSNLKGAKLKVNDTDHTTTSVEDGEIKFTFTAEELATPTIHKLTVSNAAGAAVTTLEFTVTERSTPEGGSSGESETGAGGEAVKVPELTGVTPVNVPAGTAGQEVVIAGSNLKGAQLKVNDTDHATTSAEDGEIKFTFTAEELATPITYTLSVSNDAGVATTTLTFEVIERRTADSGTPAERGTGAGGQPEPEAPVETGSGTIIDITNAQIPPTAPTNSTPTGEQSGNGAAPAGGETPLAPGGTNPDPAAGGQTGGTEPSATGDPAPSGEGGTETSTALLTPAEETTSEEPAPGTTPTGDTAPETSAPDAAPPTDPTATGESGEEPNDPATDGPRS